MLRKHGMCSLPGHLVHISPWVAPLVALCAGNVVVFWLFTRAAFDDAFRPQPWHALLWLLVIAYPVATVLGAGFVFSRPAVIAMRFLPVLFALLAVAQTVRGWGADLVEGRRRLRLFILVAVALTRTGYGRDKVRDLLETQIASRVKGRVHIGAITGGLFGGVTIDSLEIRDREDSLFYASGPITVAYDLRDFFDRRILWCCFKFSNSGCEGFFE